MKMEFFTILMTVLELLGNFCWSRKFLIAGLVFVVHGVLRILIRE